jgi:hypothetical protein
MAESSRVPHASLAASDTIQWLIDSDPAIRWQLKRDVRRG